MQPTPIEWARSLDGSRGFSWNPIRGLCKINCSYCYARAIYKRFKLNPTVLFNVKELRKPRDRKKPTGIFTCSTHELFGKWVLDSWREMIFEEIEESPQHRFYILTKRPGNIQMNEMPPNVWLGTTITGQESEEEQTIRLRQLMNVKAGIHFVSFEPLLGPIASEVLEHIADGWLDWVIVGAQTAPKKMPLVDWVSDIVKARKLSDMGTALFIKNNLAGLTDNWTMFGPRLIQEFPK